MIKFNTDTNTEGGICIPSGAVADVKATIKILKIEDWDNGDSLEYQIHFNVQGIYSSQAVFESISNPCYKGPIQEYDYKFRATDVDLSTITSYDDIIQIFLDHIINGNSNYNGVGTNNAEIISPSI